MSKAANSLNGDRLSGPDFHLAHGVENSHASAKQWGGFRGIDLRWDFHDGFGAKDAVFLICWRYICRQKRRWAVCSIKWRESGTYSRHLE